ncbi:40S ribosomal protein S19-3 [Tanacetum coccineum]
MSAVKRALTAALSDIEESEFGEVVSKVMNRGGLDGENTDKYSKASMARKIYLRGGLGVGSFQRSYGGSKRNGSAPPHFCKASGGIARHILQQLQSMNIVDFHSKG